MSQYKSLYLAINNQVPLNNGYGYWAEEEINKINKENAQLICIGKKGYEYFNKRNYNVVKNYTDFWNNLTC